MAVPCSSQNPCGVISTLHTEACHRPFDTMRITECVSQAMQDGLYDMEGLPGLTCTEAAEYSQPGFLQRLPTHCL